MKPVTITVGAVAALGLAAAAQTASATPVALHGGELIKADYACGPGWHVNPWGRCVPNYYGGAYVYGWPYYGHYGWYGGGWRGGWGHGGWGRGGWGEHGGWRGHGGWR